MSLSLSPDTRWWQRFGTRLSSYSVAGVTTFIFDLSLLWVFLTFFDADKPLAVGLAFLLAVHINYLILRHSTYRDSEESTLRTYTLFLGFAVVMACLIPALVLWLGSVLDLSVFSARIIVGTVIGFASFLFNTYLNFRLL